MFLQRSRADVETKLAIKFQRFAKNFTSNHHNLINFDKVFDYMPILNNFIWI